MKRLDEIIEILSEVDSYDSRVIKQAKAIHDSEVEWLKSVVDSEVDWQDIMNLDLRDLNGYLIAQRDYTNCIERIKKSLEKR